MLPCRTPILAANQYEKSSTSSIHTEFYTHPAAFHTLVVVLLTVPIS